MVNCSVFRCKVAMTDPYIPISCAQHSDYELAIMHGKKLSVQWRRTDNTITTAILKPFDVVTSNSAEFLLAHDENGTSKKIRLDKIIKASLHHPRQPQ